MTSGAAGAGVPGGDAAAPSERAFELLLAVLERPLAERAAFLAEAAGDDAGLGRKVEELLAYEEDAEGFLPPSPRLLDEMATPGLETGKRIGPYRVAGILGRGGMGSVYCAAREDDFTKPVAIKLIQRHLLSGATVRRFHTERQILARLDHPHVARLLDGGTTDDGRPYLVMELVDGEPIDRYCDRHGLAPGDRLELFVPVLDALAYAHRNLVVHRDLKPGNVLVTDAGVPKLLDFGIAKLLDAGGEGEVAPTLTLRGERPMTPRYSSPEQVRGEVVTTASDVYSAGVLLYQLLTGRLPAGLDGCGVLEIPQRICNHEPLKPSTAVGRGGGTETARPAPGDDRRRLRRQLAGDVDAILLKALRKRPEHRYASTGELAEDVRRHLDGRPVAARRGTWTYHASRFVRRRRWGLAAAAALALVVAAAIGFEWRRLRAEGERARRFASALERLVTLADPDAESLSAAGLLAGARAQLADLEGEPELQVELLDSLGRIHRKRGNFAEARELLAEGLEIWRRARSGDHPRLALRINNLGSLELDLGNPGAAEKRFSEAVAMLERLGEGGSEGSVIYRNNLASALLARSAYAEAEALYRRGLEIREQGPAVDGRGVSNSLRSLAALYRTRGEPQAAEPLLRRALVIRLKLYGEDHTVVASVLDLLGSVRLDLGDSAEAGALLERALAVRRRRLGWEHAQTAWSERNLAAVALAEGDLATARVLLIRAYAGQLHGRPAGDWHVADVESLFGELLAAEGRFAEAEVCLVESHRALLAARGAGAVQTGDARRRVTELQAIRESR